MKAVCAWCKKEMGRRDSAPETADLITHGICDACAARLIDQLGEPLKTYLDDLAVPVLVVDGAGNEHAGNRLARQCQEHEFPRQPLPPFPASTTIHPAPAAIPPTVQPAPSGTRFCTPTRPGRRSSASRPRSGSYRPAPGWIS